MTLYTGKKNNPGVYFETSQQHLKPPSRQLVISYFSRMLQSSAPERFNDFGHGEHSTGSGHLDVIQDVYWPRARHRDVELVRQRRYFSFSFFMQYVCYFNIYDPVESLRGKRVA